MGREIPVRVGDVEVLVETTVRAARPGQLFGVRLGEPHLRARPRLPAGTRTPVPAAVEDASTAYRWLLGNTDPARIVVAGDSSGAGLVLSLLFSAEQDRLPMPAGAVLMCPTIDPTGGDAPNDDHAPRLPADQVRRIFAHYLAGYPADDPLVVPLLADLTGLPPLLIQAGAGDPAVTDAQRLAEHAHDHAVDVRLQLYPVDTDNFHLFWSFLPEAGAALHAIDEFARHLLHDATRAHPPCG